MKIVAHDIFEEKGKKITEQSHLKIDSLLAPFKDELKGFKRKVDDIYLSETRERASLKQELKNLKVFRSVPEELAEKNIKVTLVDLEGSTINELSVATGRR